ncbi:MAG TPA: hypothetical protein DEP85_07475 [Holosporales bacterium]|nr:hypothetical protein [Holosporales bacterium]
MDKHNAHRKGSFLERIIARTFHKIGFDTKLNSKELGFEADVIARKRGFTILIEAKQYDSSYLNLGSLIHEWASKGKTSGVDRTLLVITGLKDIPEKYQELAKSLRVFLWDEETVHRLNDIDSKDELYKEIGKKMEFTDVIGQLQKKALKILLVKTAVVIALMLLVLLYFQNITKTPEVSDQTQIIQPINEVESPIITTTENQPEKTPETVVQQSPEEELKQFCIDNFNEKWQKTTVHKTTLFEEYDSTYEWGKDRAYSNYKESENALTRRGTTVEEATNIYANNILKPVLDKAEFPIIIIEGSYELQDNVKIEDGAVMCDKNGILER